MSARQQDPRINELMTRKGKRCDSCEDLLGLTYYACVPDQGNLCSGCHDDWRESHGKNID